MKGFFRFFGLVVATLIGVFVTFGIQKSPDIRYTLSDPIPIELIKVLKPKLDIPPSVRQLVVKNVGDGLAKRVQVKIDASIDNYYIDKFSEADSPKVFKHDNFFELIYPDLPVGASFKIIFSGFVSASNIEIRHKNGKAKSALESNISSWPMIFTVSIGFFWFLVLILGLYSEYVSKHQTLYRSGLYSVDKIIGIKNPWYITEKSWGRILNEALKSSISKSIYHGSSIASSDAYLLLSASKPNSLSQGDWDELINSASDILEREFRKIASSGYESWILHLLSIKKPSLFPEAKWKELEQAANDGYLSYKKDKIYSLHSTLEVLKTAKPDMVSDSTWKKLMTELSEKYFSHLRDEMKFKKNPLDWLDEQDLDELDSEQVKSLQRYAYERALASSSDVDTYEKARSFLDAKKPAWIKDYDYRLIRDRAERTCKLFELEKLEKELSEKKAEIEADEIKTKKIIDKVERQLGIIHDLFNDPSSLERVEDYNNPFADGNFIALKALAKELQLKAKTDNKA